MPFWRRESEEQRRRREAEASEQAESLLRLENGGLPVKAERRLSEQSDSFFSSSLSVNELLLAKNAGYQAIGQVMGSCFYHVGWTQTYYRNTAEIVSLTEAQREARYLATNRLRLEARMLGAHGVVGVRLKMGGYDWSEKTIEFT